ncbi:MAG TPA: hypothetical protein VGE21_09515 [Flavobacteriales bacterium]
MLLLRTFLLCVLFPAAALVQACTAFKSTQHGRTLVGNNEDAWSINAQVRFEQGRDGAYGAVYFGHFNGHPMRRMVDQLGMNERGLVFDGLGIQPKSVRPVPGRKQMPFDELMPLVLRSCADVHEAAAMLRTMDNSWLYSSMLFLVDRNGEYLIVEGDTLILGNDPTYAVGNWRMSTCSDPDAIPIPRLQAGRTLLHQGLDSTRTAALEVLRSMKACRARLGEGTLFSTLFDTKAGTAQLYFYHDFDQAVTFDLKEELAKGDRVLDMAALFPVNAEYERLLAYRTPFHQRWLFVALLLLGVAALIIAAMSGVLLLGKLIARLRRRASTVDGWLQAILLLCCSATLLLLAFLLFNEGVYYFGLGQAVEPIWPPLRYLPALLVLAVLLLVVRIIPRMRDRRSGAFQRGALALFGAAELAFVGLLFYWQLVF